MAKLKKIPDTILYIYSDKTHPKAFCVDRDNPKTTETAMSWAGSYAYTKNKVKQVESKNSPIEQIKIIDLDFRGNGGRAYKVQVGEFVFDFREDALMDAFENCVIDRGVIQGKYLWVSDGGLRLIRLDSELYKSKFESDTLVASGPVEQVVGGVYEDIGAAPFIYLGKVSTVIVKTEEINKENSYWGRKREYKYTYQTLSGHAYFSGMELKCKWGAPGYCFGVLKSKKKLFKHIGNIDVTDWVDKLKKDEIKYYKDENQGRHHDNLMNVGDGKAIHPIISSYYTSLGAKWE